MTRAIGVSALFLLYYCVACDRSASAGPPSPSRTAEPSAVVPSAPSASEVPPSSTTTPPASEPPAPERSRPVRVAPKVLAASWSTYVGRRVLLSCRPVRQIDFVRTLVLADGVRFVITGPPDVTPCSATTSTFKVMGSTTVPISGRAVLPALLLEDGEEISP